ncbi:MAG: efflux RND transporter periplasmic adaptor subunit [Desulfatiglandales bacterium]
MPKVKANRVTRFVIAILFIIALLGGVKLLAGPKKGEMASDEGLNIVPVSVAKVEKRALPIKIQLVGDLKASQEVNVYPKIAGRIIQRIHVERGDWVKEGQLIIGLEKDPILAQIRQTEAQYQASLSKIKEIEANLRLLKADRERFERLYREGAVSKQRYDQIETQTVALEEGLSSAKAQAESLRASLELLNVYLRDHEIRAPMTGYISNRYVDEGTLSDTKVPILRISQDKTLKVAALVTEKDFPYLKRGVEAELYVDAYPDRAFRGKVEVINPTIDPLTRSGTVEIKVENQDLLLRSGMFARVVLHLGQKEAISIPKEALNRMAGTGTYFVFVAEGQKAQLRNVEVGLMEEGFAEIKAGLKEGELVVVKGQSRLKDGTSIKVVS